MFLRGSVSRLLRPWSRGVSGLCCPLAERGLLRLRGPNAAGFLQGLMTNDAQRLRDGAVYAHLLNVQGRSLYDVILYRFPSEREELNDILLECDVSAVEPVQAHLKVYNLRKKIDIQPCPELSVWAVISSRESQDPPAEKLPAPALLCTPDPRVAAMGFRLVAQTGGAVADVLPDTQMGSYEDYRRHRYELGVPEGESDIQPGVALPLESNLVYMNGISFSKGCYLGQELTARTHHTGVIRKRLTPVRLSSPLPREIQGAEILTAAGKAAGRYKAGIEDLGLALLRLAHISEELHMNVGTEGSVGVKASVPKWWPKASDN